MVIELSTIITDEIEVPGGGSLIVVEVKAKKGSKEISLGYYDIPWDESTTEEDFFNLVSMVEEECLEKAEKSFKGGGQSPKAFLAKYKGKDIHPISEERRQARINSVPVKEGE